MLLSRFISPFLSILCLAALSLAPWSTRAQDLVLEYDICASGFPTVVSNLTGTTEYLNIAGFYTVSECAVQADAWNLGNYFYFNFDIEPGYVLNLDRYEFESRTGVGGPTEYDVRVGSSLHSLMSISGGWQPIPAQGAGTYTNVVADNGGVVVTGLAGTAEIRIYGQGAAGIADNWWHRGMRLFGTIEPAPIPPECVSVISPVNAENFVDPSAVLQWIPSPLASGYDMYLGTDNPPTNLEDGTPLGPATTFAPSNLTYGATYFWKVVPTNAVGGATGCPVWSFRTRPDPENLSCIYTQAFDAFPLGITSDAIAEGWTNESGDDGDWTVDSGTTPSGGTGPNSDHTTGTGRYLFTESSSSGSPGSPNKTAYLVSPSLVATGLTSPVLTFWYHMFGADMGELHVDVHSGGSWHNDAMPPLSGDKGNQWLQGVADLSPYSSPIQIRFRGITGDGFASDMAIDDVQICGVPAGEGPVPARIVDFIVAYPLVTLSIGNLSPGAINTIERASGLAPTDWVEAGGFMSTGAVTNWNETLPGEWDRVNYRILSR